MHGLRERGVRAALFPNAHAAPRRYAAAVRIIAGELRGRRIAPPEGRDTRPMLDRVREALFATLGNAVEGAEVLDLFAGTGSLGLEALSRGAAGARFVERDRRALRLLEQNVLALGQGARARLVLGDALDPSAWPARAGLVLLDPPYALLRSAASKERVFEAVGRLHEGTLEPGGCLVLHCHPRDASARDFRADLAVEQRVYGNTALWYAWKRGSE